MALGQLALWIQQKGQQGIKVGAPTATPTEVG